MLDAMVKVFSISFAGTVMVKNMTSGYQDLNCRIAKLSMTGWPHGVDLLDIR